MSEILRFDSSEQLARAAAGLFVEHTRQGISSRGRFSAALSGGSTPLRLYETLATPEYRSAVEWSKVHLFWGDERCVPPEHPDSNYGAAKSALLERVPLPAENIYRMRGELEPEEAARRYEALLHGYFYPTLDRGESLPPPPSFDLILLGLGTDGHTASLFPGSAALHEQQRWAAANYIEKLASWRLTLTLPVINAARVVIFLVSGAAKADVLEKIWQEPLAGELAAYQPLPAALVKPEDGKLLWLVAD